MRNATRIAVLALITTLLFAPSACFAGAGRSYSPRPSARVVLNIEGMT